MHGRAKAPFEIEDLCFGQVGGLLRRGVCFIRRLRGLPQYYDPIFLETIWCRVAQIDLKMILIFILASTVW